MAGLGVTIRQRQEAGSFVQMNGFVRSYPFKLVGFQEGDRWEFTAYDRNDPMMRSSIFCRRGSRFRAGILGESLAAEVLSRVVPEFKRWVDQGKPAAQSGY